MQLYAIVSTIRLFGQPQTLEEAEQVMNRIGAAYFAPNKELRLFANITTAGELDPLFAFSKACREVRGRAYVRIIAGSVSAIGRNSVSSRRAITWVWISAAPSKMLRMRASHRTRVIWYSVAR